MDLKPRSWTLSKPTGSPKDEQGQEGRPQDDRNAREKLARRYALIVRTQIPGGEIGAYQFLRNSNGG